MSKINDGQPCNEPDCGICTRQDSELITDTYVNIVTYVGDYVVSTIISPELKDPTVIVMQKTGIVRIPVFTVIVGYVGQGSIEDSKKTVKDDEFIRYITRHSNIDDPKGPHEMLVDEVKAGTLNLDTPVTLAEMEAESKKYFKDGLDELDRTLGLDF